VEREENTTDLASKNALLISPQARMNCWRVCEPLSRHSCKLFGHVPLSFLHSTSTLQI